MKKKFKNVIIIMCMVLLILSNINIANAEDEIEPEWFPKLLVKGNAYAWEVYNIMGNNMYFHFFSERNGYAVTSIMGSYASLPLIVPLENDMIKKNELRRTDQDGRISWEENATFKFYSKLHSVAYGYVVSCGFNRYVNYSCYIGDDNILYYSLKITSDNGYVDYEIHDKRIDELPSSIIIEDIGFTSSDYQYGSINITRQIDSSLGITDLTSSWVLHKKGSSQNIEFYKGSLNYQYARLNGINRSSSKSSILTSNSIGKLEINDIPFGTYVLEEISSNVPNSKKESIEFTIGSYGFNYDQNGNIINGNRNITIEIDQNGDNNSPNDGSGTGGNNTGGSGTGNSGNSGGSGGNTGGSGNNTNTGGTGTGGNTGGTGGNAGGSGNGNNTNAGGSGGTTSKPGNNTNGYGNGIGTGEGNNNNGADNNSAHTNIDELVENDDLEGGELSDLESDENIIIDYSSKDFIIEKILSLFKNSNIFYYILPISLILIIIIIALGFPKKKK